MANIKRNLIYNFLLSCSQVLIPLFSIPYITRVLDPDGIGKVSFIDSFTFYLVVIAELGITVYGIREVAKAGNDSLRLNKLVSELLLLHIISSLIALVLYSAGVFLLWQKIRDERLIFLSFLFLTGHFFSVEWYFWGKERFGYIALRSVIIRLAGLVAILLFVKTPPDYYKYYAVIVAAAVATVIWNLSVLAREVKLSFRNLNWKRHLPYLSITYFINIAYSIPLMLDNVILGIINTSFSVGIYAFSVKVVRIGVTLITDSFQVFLPRIVSLNTQNESLVAQDKLKQNFQLIVLASVPMSVGLFLLADDFVVFFFGEKFTGAIMDLRILSLFPVIKALSLFFSNSILIAHFFEKKFLKNLITATGIFIACAFGLGKIAGHTGMCIALLFSEVLLLGFNFFTVKRTIAFSGVYQPNVFFDAIAGSIFFLPIVYCISLLPLDVAARVVFSIIFCIVFYVVVLLFVFKNPIIVLIKNYFLNIFKKALAK